MFSALVWGFGAGGLVYVTVGWLRWLEAGVWSQLLLIGGLIGWLVTYAFQAVKQNMTYHQQRIMRKRSLKTVKKSPRRTGAIQAEIDHVTSADKALREHKSNR